jgi:ATP-dependent Zn protease
MKNKSGTEPESAQTRKNSNNKSDKESNDFVIGLLTFIIFILFMTAWMYFSV